MKLPLSLLCLFLAVLPLHADSVDDYVRAEMTSHRIPAVVLKVVQNGVELKTSAYGMANLELGVAAQTNSVFEIGSLTKQFTAACILLLQQEGKLSIDDRISRHVPKIPEAWTNITIRHLLSHTSGIRSYTGENGFELNRRLTQAQFVSVVGAWRLEFPPGESWKYSNSGFSLLGYIVENVSGMTYWDFLHTRILSPLGMTSTQDRNPGVLITNRVAGYEQTNQIHINRDYDLTDVFSAGALVSTVGDLARWNAALDGEIILTDASKRAAWTAQRLNNGKATNYGLGWFVDQADGREVVGHGGQTSGFSASVQRFPAEKLVVIVLTNTDESVATRMARQTAKLLLDKAL